MSTLKEAIDNLHLNFGLTVDPWCTECYEDIVIDGVHYTELYDAMLVFDLDGLIKQNMNGSETNHFLNGHRQATYQVIGNWPDIGCDRYPPEYRESFSRDFPKVLEHLLQDLHSRRAVMLFTSSGDTHPCLSTLQFVVREKTLNIFAYFRSWELSEWAIYDLQLITQIVWKLYTDLRISGCDDLEFGTLTVQTPSAHVELKECK